MEATELETPLGKFVVYVNGEPFSYQYGGNQSDNISESEYEIYLSIPEELLTENTEIFAGVMNAGFEFDGYDQGDASCTAIRDSQLLILRATTSEHDEAFDGHYLIVSDSYYTGYDSNGFRFTMTGKSKKLPELTLFWMSKARAEESGWL